MGLNLKFALPESIKLELLKDIRNMDVNVSLATRILEDSARENVAYSLSDTLKESWNKLNEFLNELADY